MAHPKPYAILLFLLVSCNVKEKKPDSTLTSIIEKYKHQRSKNVPRTNLRWLDSTNQHFPPIVEGDSLIVQYRFQNTGNYPLLIYSVNPSCGCTVASKPSKPIAPNDTARITAVFHSNGRVGFNEKQLHLSANTSPEELLSLKFSVQVTR